MNVQSQDVRKQPIENPKQRRVQPMRPSYPLQPMYPQPMQMRQPMYPMHPYPYFNPQLFHNQALLQQQQQAKYLYDAASNQFQQMIRIQPKYAICNICKTKQAKPDRKFCHSCSLKRNECANDGCNVKCGQHYVLCFNCNPVCQHCFKRMSTLNGCNVCATEISKILGKS